MSGEGGPSGGELGFDIETYRRPGSAVEGRRSGVEASDGRSMVERFASPEWVARAKESPWGSEHTTEYLIMDRLLGVLVEQGSELDPVVLQHIRDFVGIFRIIAAPNMNPSEQEFLRNLSQATSVNFAALRFEATSEVVDDMRSMWKQHGLRIPTDSPPWLAPNPPPRALPPTR